MKNVRKKCKKDEKDEKDEKWQPKQSGDTKREFAQMLIVPAPLFQLEQVDELSATDRGEGGYGSTKMQ